MNGKSPIWSVLVFFTALLFSISTYAQPNCDISIDTDQPVCRNVSFELSVDDCESCTYEWKKDGIVVGMTSSIIVEIAEQTLFTVKVTDGDGLSCESDPYLVMPHPEIFIEIEQLQLTCTNGDNDNGNTAKLKARASGEFGEDEYHYFWDVKPIQVAPGDSSVALGLKAHLNYSITVIDNHGCFEKDTIRTEAYDNPEIETIADPDTAFVQNPHVQFSFINHSADSIELSNFFWDFNDDLDTANSYLPDPLHSFILNDQEIIDGGKEYMVVFTAVNPEGCDTTYNHTITVIPMKLFIPNVFTPNGDGSNDKFVITEPEASDNPVIYETNHYYETSKLLVFNRQGRVIFRDDDYQNDWDGGDLAEGVYFYILKATGPKGTDVYKGSISLIRGK